MGFIGDIFGKGGSSSSQQAPPMPSMPDNSGEIAGMMGMMQEMMGGIMEGMQNSMMQAMQQQEAMQNSMQENMLLNMSANMELPEIYRNPEIDWTGKQEQLSKKASADYNRTQILRKSRLDTVLTSPLLDEEEPNVGGSVLSGD